MSDRVTLTEADISELVAKYPLPAGVPDNVLNRTDLADFFGVSANTIGAWISAGMPVESQGTNGQAYEFLPSKCWAWKSARDRSEAAARSAAQDTIAAMRLALTGGKAGDTIDALSPKEKQEAIAAAREHETFKRHRNELMVRADVEDLLENMFLLIRDASNTMPDALERANVIAGDDVETVIRLGDEMLEALRGQIMRFWSDRPLKSANASTGGTLFDA